jgi:hypothetical protein
VASMLRLRGISNRVMRFGSQLLVSIRSFVRSTLKQGSEDVSALSRALLDLGLVSAPEASVRSSGPARDAFRHFPSRAPSSVSI